MLNRRVIFGITCFAILAAIAAAPAAAQVTVTSVKDASQFIVAPGETDAMSFDLRNAAATPVSGTAQFEQLVDGRMVAIAKQHVTLAASAATPVSYTFNAKDIAAGECDVRLTLRADGAAVDAAPVLAYEQPVAVAGADDVFIVFDKMPITRGMDFDRTAPNTGSRQIVADGAKRWIWFGGYQSDRGGPGWWHSMYFNITDPRFQNGKMPAVDARMVFTNAKWSPINLTADTAGGSRELIGSSGAGEGIWGTATGQIDNALFARTDYHSAGNDMKSDGFDLRYNSCTADAQLKSVFIHGYDVDHHPDYHRLLRFDGMDAGRELFIFTPGEKANLSLKFRNIAHVGFDGDCQVRLTDDMGNEVWSHPLAVTVPAGGPFTLPVPLDTAGLKQGGYIVEMSMGRPGADGRRDVFLSPSVHILVSEQSPIAKAKPGEFLYGVDPGVDYRDDRWLQWLDFMGCDITRGNGANGLDEDWAPAMAEFAKHHIQTTVFADIRWDADPVKRAANTKMIATISAARAKQFGEQAKYWELGNEPDLTGFYPGPIEDYCAGMVDVAAAIHAANPNAVVMNGGLSFAGPDATIRAKKFIEMFPTESLDAIAYHGHGPLVWAERRAYENVHAVAVQYQKANRPFIETESGVASHTPNQMRIQSRTAVEKMVYAQSVGEPMLLWFRLNIMGEDSDYTNTYNVHEPRPCILSYRTMTKTLKGLAFTRKLDLGSSSQEGYLFAAKDSDARAVVVWDDARGGGTTNVLLSNKPDAIHDAKLVDLFGNITPLEVKGGVATVPVDLDPSYITWHDAAAPDAVAALPPMVLAGPLVYVTPGADDAVAVKVFNPFEAPLDATLVTSVGQTAGLTLATPEVPVHLAAKETQNVPVTVKLAADPNAVKWPRRWTTFAPVPTESVDVRNFTKDIPAELTANGKTIKPQTALQKGDVVDLAPLGGGFAEKREAILFAYLDSPVDQTIRVGSSADWWEQWFINGQPVFDDLATGNQGPQSILEHAFDMPLKAGRNLIAVRVLSGSQGWKLFNGGPQELAAAKSSATGGGNTLNFQLKRDAAVLARARASVTPRNAVPALGGIAWDGPAADWNAVEPAGVLTEEGIVNEWAKQPDASKWWKGLADLSGQVWLAGDAQHLYVVAAIREGAFHPAANAGEIDRGNSLRVAVAGANGKVLQLAASATGNACFQREAGAAAWTALATGVTVKAERMDAADGGITWYRLAIDRTLIPDPSGKLAINVMANQSDWGVHKQSDAWFSGIDAAQDSMAPWYQFLLR